MKVEWTAEDKKRWTEARALPQPPVEWRTEFWSTIHERLHPVLTPPPDGLLSDPVVHTGLCFRDPVGVAHELKMISKHFGRARVEAACATEPRDGIEPFPGIDAVTQSEVIHQMYHIARWEQLSGAHLLDQSVIVEWGGGYGGMARVVNRLHPDCTYVCVDLPEVLALHAAFNPRAVIVTDQWLPLLQGRINLLSAGMAALIPTPPDLFISTWALSECTAEAQDWVNDRGLLAVPHLILAYDESKDAFANSARPARLARYQGGGTVCPSVGAEGRYFLR